MKHPVRKTFVAVALVVGVSAGVAGTAFATTGGPSTPTSAPASNASDNGARLGAIKGKAEAAISGRLESLDSALAGVTSSSVLTASDKQALLALLNGDVSGLTALDSKTRADTTVARASVDYKQIFTGYRVYALALPQVRLVTTTDRITGRTVPRLSDDQAKLADLLAGKDKNKDTAAVQAAMSNIAGQITAIITTANGLSGRVLALTPAQWNANHAVLVGPRQSLQTAQAKAKTARSGVAFVRAAIRSGAKPSANS